MSSCLPQATWTSSTCAVDVTLHCLVAVSAIGAGKSGGCLPHDVQQTLCVLPDASSDVTGRQRLSCSEFCTQKATQLFVTALRDMLSEACNGEKMRTPIYITRVFTPRPRPTKEHDTESIKYICR